MGLGIAIGLGIGLGGGVIGASQFAITVPAYETRTSAFDVVVTANGIYAGTIAFTSSDGSAVLPANNTLTSGTGTFSVTLKTAGVQSITATDSVTAGITGAVSIVAKDAFTDTNGTLLTDHTMTLGGGWATGNYAIQSNKAKWVGSPNLAITDSGQNDHTALATISAADGGGLTVTGRLGSFDCAWAIVTAAGQLEVWETVGSPALLGSAACVPATPFLMTAKIKDGVITVTVENVTVTCSLVQVPEGTYCGLYSTSSTTTTWDNFQVTTP